MLRYDYEITYKKGTKNQVVDALSRIHGLELLAMTFSTISTELLDRVKASWEVNPDYRDTLGELTQGTSRGRFALKYELFKRDGNIIMGGDNELRMNILREFHASPTGGHSRVTTTFKWVSTVILEGAQKTRVRIRVKL